MSKKIEAEFAEAVANINGQIKIAAMALHAAAVYAKDAGIDIASYYGEYDEVKGDFVNEIEKRSLMRAIEEAGWSSSSMSC